MSKPTIYLAGPMTGLTWEEATEWRDMATLRLTPQWRVITPVRGQTKYNKATMGDVITASTMTEEQPSLPLAYTATGITAQDQFYIDQSDWLLVNFLNANRVSIGTVWEMGYAWGRNKMIISVIEPNSIHDHPFVRRRSHVFVPDLDEAIEYLGVMAV